MLRGIRQEPAGLDEDFCVDQFRGPIRYRPPTRVNLNVEFELPAGIPEQDAIEAMKDDLDDYLRHLREERGERSPVPAPGDSRPPLRRLDDEVEEVRAPLEADRPKQPARVELRGAGGELLSVSEVGDLTLTPGDTAEFTTRYTLA